VTEREVGVEVDVEVDVEVRVEVVLKSTSVSNWVLSAAC
jgi:hypothetical protein